jgi:dTDP-4-dehydrorhamnose 3,5-epimerase
MIFSETKLAGVFIIDPEPFEDERGFFARSWSQPEFEAHGIEGRLAECNISFNSRKGILRGLHYQASPFEQSKLVRCTSGCIYDVAVDLRGGSPTLHQWVAVELTEDNHRMLFIPGGCAHGYQTLTERSEVFYQMSNYYNAESGRGVRWNDPAFGIEWPLPDPIMIERDRTYELLSRSHTLR